jgi:hypothetical protein
MKDNQLAKILKTLKKTELRELQSLVEAQATRKEHTQLFNFMVKNLNSTPSVWKPENVFAAIAPDRVGDEKLLRNVQYDLMRIVKSFLMQKQLEMDEPLAARLLAKAYAERGLEDMQTATLREGLAKSEAGVSRNATYHLRNYRLHDDLFEQISLSHRKGEMPFEAMSSELTAFFAAETLRQASLQLSYKAVSAREISLPMLDEVISWVEKQEDTEGSVLTIYKTIFLLLKTNNLLYFKELKEKTKAHLERFPQRERRILYLVMLNFCIRQVNEGAKEYFTDLFEIYKEGLETQALFEHGFVSRFTYKNAVTTAMRLGEWTWARNFIEDYQKYLPPKDRRTTYAYNLGAWHFRQGDYKAATKLLQGIDFQEVFANIGARQMLVRMFFETNDYDPLTATLDSFQTYINRQKDIGYQRDNYLNFIKIVRRMLRLDLKSDTIRKTLIEEIGATTTLAEREWLLEKLIK